MSIYSLASDVTGDDRDGFVVAVHQELDSHGFRDISRRTDKRRLWKHAQAEQTVLGVTRYRGQRFGAAHDPLDEAVLLVGGESERGQLHLVEDAILCWGKEWGEQELRRQLDARARRANDCVGGGKGGILGSIRFGKTLELIEQHRSDLEERFSPGNIVSTLAELSETRYERLREQLRARLVALLVPDANEGIPGGELPPGVVRPYRPDDPKDPPSIDFEAFVSGRDAIDEQAPFQVTFENGPRADRGTPVCASVGAWLQEPNPVLGGHSPDEILRNGDQAEHEYLFGLIAGIECGVHS